MGEITRGSLDIWISAARFTGIIGTLQIGRSTKSVEVGKMDLGNSKHEACNPKHRLRGALRASTEEGKSTQVFQV